MEVSKNLQFLSGRAKYLCDRVNEEIFKYDDNTISFCRVCSENDRFCRIKETPLGFEEIENLIIIRDSLKDVENMLLFLQKLESYQQKELHEAFKRLEESRLFLLLKVNQFPVKEEKVSVIEELNDCLADGKPVFSWKIKENMEGKIEKNKWSGFLVDCIKSLFSPLNWVSTAGVATKIIVISAISSVVYFGQSRNYFKSGQRNIFLGLDSESNEKMDGVLTKSKSPLDVLYGKG